jgi:hypothetical protein
VGEGQVGAGEDRGRPRWALAVGLSALLHLLFGLLIVWAPPGLRPQPLARAVDEPEPLSFRFAEVPFDAERARAEGPAPAPTRPAREIGLPGEALPLPPAPPAEDRSTGPREPPPSTPPLPSAAAEPPAGAERGGQELASARDDPRAPAASPAPGSSVGPSEPQDLAQALRDFGRSMSRPSREPSGSPSGGGRGRDVFVPDISELPTTGFGVGNLVFESRDYDWDDYGRQIYWAVLRAWYRRLWLTADEFEKWGFAVGEWTLSHRAQVRFTIERSGQITAIALEAGSGCSPLDDSATAALTEVVLPPLPADFPRGHEVIHGTFTARGFIREMRRELEYYHAAGFF